MKIVEMFSVKEIDRIASQMRLLAILGSPLVRTNKYGHVHVNVRKGPYMRKRLIRLMKGWAKG